MALPNSVFIDLETYSGTDLGSAGIHAYVESPDFQILIVAYSINGGKILSFCPCLGDPWPTELLEALKSKTYTKHAFNAAFERLCLAAVGIETYLPMWRCTMIKALYCGLPGSLGALSKVLRLGDAAKDAEGKKLIKMFSCPVKGYKKYGYRRRHYPGHFPDEWMRFVAYCEQDVKAEMAVYKKLARYRLPAHEWEAWALDQKIADEGVLIDTELASAAIKLRSIQKDVLLKQMQEVTGLDKPNTPAKLAAWLTARLGIRVTSVAKDNLAPLLEGCEDEDVRKALDLRSRMGKSSVAKFGAMLKTICSDRKARGFLQFYGASRTGRWAGRRIQPQNLPRNYLKDMVQAIEDTKTMEYEEFLAKYPDLISTLSQLIRPGLTAEEGFAMVVADYSAIEARVLAYLAGEEWRLRVFRTHGKIYEASAAATFNVPFESITKDSPLRQQGKTTELALGYQGSVGAMRKMDYDNVLDEDDGVIKEIVNKWRKASPAIVRLWRSFEDTARAAVENPGRTYAAANCGPIPITMCRDDNALWVKLPSGRSLAYWGAHMTEGKYGMQVSYFGLNDKKQWRAENTYGGKLTENIVQAYARDLLSEAMVRADSDGHIIQLHVHDEMGIKAPLMDAPEVLEGLEDLMSIAPNWAEGIPLKGDGFITTFYKK